MSMNFRVGQKVVCVDASGAPELTYRAIYTVAFVDILQGNHAGLDLVEVQPPDPHRWCFFAWRFRPIVERKTDISIFTSMLKPSKVEA